MEGLSNQADCIDLHDTRSVLDGESVVETQSQRVLIAERDSDATRALHHRLSQLGIEVSVVERAEEVVAAIERSRPHLIMLDWDFPSVITMEVVRRARSAFDLSSPRLIALSTFSAEQHVVSGLELGVDDYVIKPFSLAEIVARVRALLRARRGSPEERDFLEFGELRMDSCDARATVRDRSVSLRAMEFRLLRFLMRHPERAFRRETLLIGVWGRDSGAEPRAVDVTVQRIRRALEPHGYDGYLQTIRGVGYRLSRSLGGLP